jgi:hypothetical protein
MWCVCVCAVHVHVRAYVRAFVLFLFIYLCNIIRIQVMHICKGVRMRGMAERYVPCVCVRACNVWVADVYLSEQVNHNFFWSSTRLYFRYLYANH